MPERKKHNKSKTNPRIKPVGSFLYLNNHSRQKYKFKKNLFNPFDNLLIPDFQTAQFIAGKINQCRARESFSPKTVRAADLNASALINQIYKHIVELFFKKNPPDTIERMEKDLHKSPGKQILFTATKQYIDLFHPDLVHDSQSFTETIREIFLVNLTNLNPAVSYFRELFDDSLLKEQIEYSKTARQIKLDFAATPPFGPDNMDIFSMLVSPFKISPLSLSGQLKFIYHKWKPLIKDYLLQILNALDLLREEKPKMTGPGEIPEYKFSNLDWILEQDNYSDDTLWMSNLVLIAKHTYVWLSQLSFRYGQSITKLDRIPDQVLDELADQGFTGLWLIGLWERSPASQQIKKRCGNPDAMASAYSIVAYRIAEDLGGETALQKLKERALQRNIRLCCDMVPNHMAIDSEWVINNPDYFIYLDHSPYSDYSFNGPDLSSDPEVGIFLEDHYYDQTDAAVVFKRINKRSGETRYIYHGNDGTSMPWNDTAQLNYLNPETRKTVMQTMLNVARLFPIIRFDAAMTLTRKHYQRLWFPEPGSGGDIPTRSLKGLSTTEFQKYLPNEFWHEVVERFSAEQPDTLLLAEAFWLMEGYFVRNLGMHRVYNSAFMNFLKNEQNAEFRNSIKNIINFDPEILKRLVNFMSNPDEETAVAQFGKKDKYFCVCLLMITLPGLPLFNHGQIEGFSEKYGMEYKKPYYSETADQELVKRHYQEIFPLLKKRYVFSEAKNFLLYDLYLSNGKVDEDVIAFSNRHGSESVLIVCNNRYTHKSGWIKSPVPKASKKNQAKKGDGNRPDLLQGLGFTPSAQTFIIFREYYSQLEYIRSSKDLQKNGLFILLQAYKYQFFLDFRQVSDTESEIYSQLERHLKGRGIDNINRLMQKKFLNPLYKPIQNLLNPESLSTLQRMISPSVTEKEKHLIVCKNNYFKLMQVLNELFKIKKDPVELSNRMVDHLSFLLKMLSHEPPPFPIHIKKFFSSNPFFTLFLLIWFFMELVRRSHLENQSIEIKQFLHDFGTAETLQETLKKLGLGETDVQRYLFLLEILLNSRKWSESFTSEAWKSWIVHLMEEPQMKRLVGVNLHRNVLWFHRESFEELINWIYITNFFSLVLENNIHSPQTDKRVFYFNKIWESMWESVAESTFQWSNLIPLMTKKISLLTNKWGFYPGKKK